MYYAFRSTTLDIITSYCFAQSYSTLTYPSFQHPMIHGIDQTLPMFWFLHAMPIMHKILPLLNPIMGRINPDIKAFLDFRVRMGAQIDEVLKDPGSLDRTDHENVYHHLLNIQPSRGHHQIPSKTSLLHEVRMTPSCTPP